jgi:hypothetical protein
MMMPYCPFPSSIPQFCRDAARLYYLCEKHKNHHKVSRKLSITGISALIDKHTDAMFYAQDHLEKCIEEGSLVGVVYFKNEVNSEVNILNKLETNLKYISQYRQDQQSGKPANPDRITDTDIERAKETPILSLVEQDMQLRKAGKDYMGTCPLHEDRKPSFSVSVEKNIFYCFSCQTGGGPIDYLVKIKGYDFIEAVRRLK